MALTWVGEDAFDGNGVRVAMVMKCTDRVFVPNARSPKIVYWVAFVAGEYVLIDEAPGRWKKQADAMAAAEATYRELLPTGADLSMSGTYSPPEPREPGIVGALRRARRNFLFWRTPRRERRERRF
jgi:hypothetical protein